MRRYPGEHIALFLDGANSHRTDRLTVPENIALIALPTYSSQLCPIENLWKILRECFFPNRDYQYMDALEENLAGELLYLEEAPQLVQSVTGYVEETIDRLVKGRTTITIAHRRSAIRNADCVYVLENSALVEASPFRELEKTDGGVFAQLLKTAEQAAR